MNAEAWYRRRAFPHLDPGPDEPPVNYEAVLWRRAMEIAFPALFAARKGENR